MKFLFSFSAVCLSCYALCCVAINEDTMNQLLSYPGWTAMAKPDHRLSIVVHSQTGETELTMDDFRATPVTPSNEGDKIRLAHQFLSCSYARVLANYCDLESVIGYECRRMNTAEQSYDCLMDYLEVIKSKHPMVARMKGALLALQRLSTDQEEIKTGVYQLLADLQSYYLQDTRSVDTTVNEQCVEIEQHLSDISNRALSFYKSLCRPITIWKSYTKHTDNRTHDSGSCDSESYIVKTIKDQLERNINNFNKSHDGNSGFQYHDESNTTTFDDRQQKKSGIYFCCCC